MKFLIVLLSVLSLFTVHCSHEALVGGFSEPTLGLLADPHFLDVKTFILEKHPELTDAEVTNISTQVVAGTNYKVRFATPEGKQFEVVVFDQPWTHHRSILSFHEVGAAQE